MAEKLPWFPLFVADFTNDENVIRMTYEEEGLYIALLRHQWINGSIPADDDDIRAILKPHTPEALARVKPRFSQATEATRLVNIKLQEILENQEKKHRNFSRSGRKGGIAKALKARSPALARLKPGSSEALATEQSRGEVLQQQLLPTPAKKPSSGNSDWIAPFLAVYEQHVGVIKPGRLAMVIAPVIKAIEAQGALEAFTLWCRDPKRGKSVVQFGQRWRDWENFDVYEPDGVTPTPRGAAYLEQHKYEL